MKEKQYDPEWFSKAQQFISQVPSLHSGIDQLIGVCYKKAEEIADIRDKGAVSFAKAYKNALDMKKHSGQVLLPRHLWDEVPKNLHKYLASD